MERRELSTTERRDWLRLSRTENVGPITFRQLIDRFGSASTALEALPEIAKRGGKGRFRIPPDALIEDEIAHTQKMGGIIVAWCEADYPKALAAIEDAPPLITALG